MKRGFACVVAGITALAAQNPAAFGTLSVSSGTLSANASSNGGGQTIKPNVAFTPPSTGTSASVSGASISQTLSQNNGSILMHAVADIASGSGGSANTGGTATLLEDATEPVTASISRVFLPNGAFGYLTYGLKLTDANNTVVFDLQFDSFGTPNKTAQATLTPGLYTLDWHFSDGIATGTMNHAIMDLSMVPLPEPNSCALIIPAAALTFRRRRARRA